MKKLLQHQRHNIILERLNNGETLSITELAREWNIIPKTVQRDFNKLVEGNYGIIRADGGKKFTIAKSHNRSKNAATAVKILDSISADIGGKFYTKAQSALHKIQEHIDSPFYTRIDVEDISSHLDIIEKLEEAISNQRKLNITYKALNKDTPRVYKNINPYKIIIFDGFFYLLSEATTSENKIYYPKFYLKEIRSVEILETTFTVKEEILTKVDKAIGFWFDIKAKPFDVTLLLDNKVIIYLERKPIKGQYLKKNLDGTAELTITVTHKSEIFTLLKQWLPQIKVIEPYELQKEFNAILDNYVVSST